MANKRREIPLPEWQPGIWRANGYGVDSGNVVVFAKMERAADYHWHHGFDKYEAYSHQPDFTWDNRDRDPPNHVYVELGYYYSAVSYKENGQIKYRHEWQIRLDVGDVDDGLFQIWRPLTRENWLELCRIYHEELVIPEVFTGEQLRKLGFEC